MIIHKQVRRNVEGNKDVNKVMLLSCEYEEDAEKIEDPGKGVQKINSSGSIYSSISKLKEN